MYAALILSALGPLYVSESDVYRRQILEYKDSPRAERVIQNSKNDLSLTFCQCH